MRHDYTYYDYTYYGYTYFGRTLAPPGALPPALGARQRHHADYQLHDYYFGGCYAGERLRAEHSWFWGYGSKTNGAAAAANLSGVLSTPSGP